MLNTTLILLVIILSFGLTALGMPLFIRYMKTKQFGQVAREEGPKWHEVKNGTPTMGGTVFIVAVVITMLIVMLTQFSMQAALLIFCLFFFGIIGFLDDFIKIFRKQNEGLKSKQKFVLQLIGSLFFAIIYLFTNNQADILLPFFGQVTSPLIVVPFIMIWVTGFSNAVNLTDGLDGLVAGTGSLAYGAYAILAYRQGNWAVMLFCLAVVSALLSFFMFNKKPAKIFMGDVGSLALGAGLAAISITLEAEWSLLVVGLVFVVETLSVILQVWSFKTRGKRIFKMSPIHHHFEMVGWSEVRVVVTFWLVGLIAAILALTLF